MSRYDHTLRVYLTTNEAKVMCDAFGIEYPLTRDPGNSLSAAIKREAMAAAHQALVRRKWPDAVVAEQWTSGHYVGWTVFKEPIFGERAPCGSTPRDAWAQAWRMLCEAT